MWAKRILMSLTLLGLLNGAVSQRIAKSFAPNPPYPQYPPYQPYSYVSPPIEEEPNCRHILITPTVLQSGRTGQACVFMDCVESVWVTVTLEGQPPDILIFDEDIASPFFECRDFSVPAVTKAQLVYVTFSANGNTSQKYERKGVVIDIMPESCFVQTDKTMYKPGDTVNARVFCLDYDMRPTVQNFTRVRIVEPTGVTVQIVVVQMSGLFIASVEVALSDDASAGGYQLIFEREPGDPVTKYLSVQPYILPRFDSTVTCPNTLSVLETSAFIDISGEYIYGEPLPATVIGKCCRNKAYTYGRAANCFKGLEDICYDFTGELDETGKYRIGLDLNMFKLQYSEYNSNIQCTFTIKEAGTGVLDTKYCYMYISSQPVNLRLDYDYISKYYKHGLDYTLRVILTDDKDQPLKDRNITIEVDGIVVKIVTTDDEGKAECGIDTSHCYKANFTIRASYQDEDQCYLPSQSPGWSPVFNGYYDPGYPFVDLVAYRFFAESNCFLYIKKLSQEELACGSTQIIEVEYIVTELEVGKATEIAFYYMFKGKVSVLLYGHHYVDLSAGLKGSFKLEVLITSEMSKSLELLVFAPMSTEIISDYSQFNVENCFENQVSLEFTQEVVAPGSEVTQLLTAAPGSVCAVRAADASLALLNAYDGFNPDSIYSALTYYEYAYQVQGFDLEDPAPPCEDPNKEVFCHGSYYRITSSATDGDTHGNLRSMSLIFATELKTQKSQVCGMEEVNNPPILFKGSNVQFATLADASSSLARGSGGAGSIVTIRKDFGDTFGWQIVLIGADGTAIATSKIPDQITKWTSNMFCLSQTEGVGFTNQSATVTTILVFFGEVSMPGYCTRGEKIMIVVTAANYEDDCKKVSFNVTASDGSPATPLNGDENPCICKGQRVSRQYSMAFISLGDITITLSASTTHISDSCDGPNDDSKPSRTDTVENHITVEAEGINQQVTISHMIIVTETTKEFEAPIYSPDNLVEGSFNLQLTVVGDTVALMADSLEELLSLPAGCCEQNLAKMLPIVYLVKYLNSTSGLSDELFERAKGYLSLGYAAVLGCRRYDGWFSLYRHTDMRNYWFLINTFYAFAQMKGLVYVDENMLQQTLFLVGSAQDLSSGCFNPSGIFSPDQGDLNITIRLTAYVVSRLLQSDSYGLGGPMIAGGLRCLQAVDYRTVDIYTLAYLFHVAALAKLEIWGEMYLYVMELVILEEGAMHWGRPNQQPWQYYYVYKYASAEVDITATIMIAIMRGPHMDQETLDVLAQIAIWLSRSLDSIGYFVNAQDTTSAMQALTIYGELVYVQNANVEISVTLEGVEVARTIVTEDNKMLVQRFSLPVVYGTYIVAVTGTGNPLIQLVADFHTEVTNEGSPLSLIVTTRTESCIEGVAQVIYTDICASYNGEEAATDMIIIVVKSLTGYSWDQGALYSMLSADKIADVVFKDNHVYLYLNSLKRGAEVCFTLTSYLEQRALLYQNSVVYMYFYSNPAISVGAVYTYPCSPFVAG